MLCTVCWADVMRHGQVWMPWVQLVVGEAQFRCAMAFLWENMFEDADFGPPRPAIYPTGAAEPLKAWTTAAIAWHARGAYSMA